MQFPSFLNERKKNFLNERKKNGFSLVEAAIVLGVVGLVIGGIWVAAAVVNEDWKVSKTTRDMVEIVNNTQNLISSADANAIGTNVDLIPTLMRSGRFPSDWIVNNTIKSPFGTTVWLVNNPPYLHFAIHSVPRSSCIKLLVRLSSMSAQANTGAYLSSVFILEMQVNNGAYLSSYNFPISSATAATACNQSTNYILFIFTHTRIN